MTDAPADQNLLLVDADMDEGRMVPAASGSVIALTARAPDKPPPNEDGAAVLVCDGRRAVLAVADGLGGQPAGQQASSIALRELAKSVERVRAEGIELRDAILNGFENANRAVMSLALGSGTTLSAVEVDGHDIRPYHAGDSSILVVGQRSRIRLQTVAHSPVGYAVEAGLLEEGEAMHHEHRHIVSNMIGIEEMRIEIGPVVRLRPRDTLLLATDGLTDNLHTAEITDRIRKGPLETVSRTLWQMCHERMIHPVDGQPSKPDDVTYIVFRPRTGGRKRGRRSPVAGGSDVALPKDDRSGAS